MHSAPCELLEALLMCLLLFPLFFMGERGVMGEEQVATDFFNLFLVSFHHSATVTDQALCPLHGISFCVIEAVIQLSNDAISLYFFCLFF